MTNRSWDSLRTDVAGSSPAFRGRSPSVAQVMARHTAEQRAVTNPITEPGHGHPALPSLPPHILVSYGQDIPFEEVEE